MGGAPNPGTPPTDSGERKVERYAARAGRRAVEPGFRSRTGELVAVTAREPGAELDRLVAAAERQLRELDDLADPVPLSLRGTALRSSGIATDLLAAADAWPGSAGAEARRLAISLMCASNRAMALWSKRVGRMPLDAFLGDGGDGAHG